MRKDRSPELADIVRENLIHMSLDYHRLNVLKNIMNCRTAALGGHLNECVEGDCVYEEISYNSCRDRNCPKCMGENSIKWRFNRLEEVLPVEYYHMVFSVTSCLFMFYYNNKKTFLNILFKSVNESFKEVSKKLKIQPGVIALLHTWNQLLDVFPHVHCLLPAGGLSKGKDKWLPLKMKKLLKNEYLSTVFKKKFISNLEKAYSKGKIKYDGDEESFKKLMETAFRRKWKISVKKPFKGPVQVISYLSNYVHRIAISNRRIKSFVDNKVTFDYIDRSDGNKVKEKVMDGLTFLKKFSNHILPKGLIKLRYFGFMANSCKKKNLKLCRELIEKSGYKIKEDLSDYKNKVLKMLDDLCKPYICPCCKKGQMKVKRTLPKNYKNPGYPVRGG